jgi:hypothetical protein
MRYSNRVSIPTFLHLIAALALLGGAGTARAAVCTVDAASTLETGLIDPVATSEAGDCDTEETSVPGEEGSEPIVLLTLSEPVLTTSTYGQCQYARGGHHHHDCKPPVVPVPAAGWLLVSGALGLLTLARRRRGASDPDLL